MSTATYRNAGVDIAAADGWLSRMRARIRSTHGPEVVDDLGAFAGLYRLSARRFRDPVLVASTDGVGTKLTLAHAPREFEAIGVDVVAMNTNDVLVYGAQPLFFLDYLAVGHVQPALMSALLRGIVRGCRESGCALLGGETAEMPGAYGPGEYDVAGFCVGVVERTKLIDGSRVRPGDPIVGLASSGVHANGFSLVRQVFTKAAISRYRRQLLVPTRVYVKPVLRLVQHADIRALVHVTGGGLARRLPSLVSRCRGVRVRLRPSSWPIPAIFHAIRQAGTISTNEMMATFNMGVGMALVCRPHDVAGVIRLMAQTGIPAWPIGTIERNKH